MYKIVGADNKEYGPVTKEEILEWIAQGRANAKTVTRFEDGPWKPLVSFDEFKTALHPAAPTPLRASAAPPPFMAGAPLIAETNSMAVTGLVCGILGILCCPCIGPILAIIFSAIGLNQIKANPAAYTTDAVLPKIGLGLGIAALAFHLIYVVFYGGLAVISDLFK